MIFVGARTWGGHKGLLPANTRFPALKGSGSSWPAGWINSELKGPILRSSTPVPSLKQ